MNRLWSRRDAPLLQTDLLDCFLVECGTNALVDVLEEHIQGLSLADGGLHIVALDVLHEVAVQQDSLEIHQMNHVLLDDGFRFRGRCCFSLQLLVLCIDFGQMLDHFARFPLQKVTAYHIPLRVHRPAGQRFDHTNLFEMARKDPNQSCSDGGKDVKYLDHKIASLLQDLEHCQNLTENQSLEKRFLNSLVSVHRNTLFQIMTKIAKCVSVNCQRSKFEKRRIHDRVFCLLTPSADTSPTPNPELSASTRSANASMLSALRRFPVPSAP